MKIGMIFECGPQGADRKVCEHLVSRLAEQYRLDLQAESLTLDNKKKLIAGCGQSAAQLLFVDGCDRVVIIWDLYPSWREEAPCRKEDREAIERSLKAAHVDMGKVELICIEEELEAWLLADHRAIDTVLSKPHRKVNVKRQKAPERHNPKKRMIRLFNDHVGRPYSDRIHAERIAKALPDLQKLKRVATFQRFASKVADVKL